jgi:SAM-dependent methyltransferase
MSTNKTTTEKPSSQTSTAVGTRNKTVAWYNPTLPILPSRTKDLLQTYSRIPAAEIEAHIHKIVRAPPSTPSLIVLHRIRTKKIRLMYSPQRDEAWDIWPYPCIGQFRFLTLALPYTPSYAAIVKRLQTAPNARFLDLGCCFGQDLRALAAEGVEGRKLVGVELHGEFHGLGHKLFRDGGQVRTLGATLIAADLFDLLDDDDGSTAAGLYPLLSSIDILQASAFLHLFTWDKQLDAGAAIVRLLKPGPGALVVGTQVGSKRPGLYEQGRMYLHDVGTFRELWKEIGRKTASEWHVEAVMSQEMRERKPWDDENVCKLDFEVTRVR